MEFCPGDVYYIYNEGNNRQNIFYTAEDYLTFLRMVRKVIVPFSEMIAYSLMPNDFHFMLYTDLRCTPKTKQGRLLLDPITNGIRKLLSGYARIFNARYNQTGSVFRQKTKAKNLSEIDLLPHKGSNNFDSYYNCFHYIHQNPLKARLVTNLEDWEFSSFKDYAGLRNGTLCNQNLAIKYCSFQPDNFLKYSYSMVPEEIIIQLR